MVEDAVAGDRLIAMAVLAPGWEADYQGRPALFADGVSGADHHALPPRRRHLQCVVAGVAEDPADPRVAVAAEFPPGESATLRGSQPAPQAAARAALQRKLRKAFMRVLPVLPGVEREQLDQLLAEQRLAAGRADRRGQLHARSPPGHRAIAGRSERISPEGVLLAQLSAATAGLSRPGRSGVSARVQ